MNKVAIVGFGRAGHSAAGTLRKNGFDGTICVYTDYVTGVENPMLTTYYASEKIEEKEVMPFGDLKEIAEELRLKIFEGTTVNKILPDEKKVFFTDAEGNGGEEAFDAIVLATGSAPILPDFQAKDPKKVITIRSIGDARRMNYALHHAKKVLVVGCSMIGIKVVQGLTEHEADITLIDYAGKVFPTAVLPGAEEILAGKIRGQGVKLLLSTGINGISEEGEKLLAEFGDGTKEPFDTVFLCMGTRARIDVAEEAGIECGKAIVVDDHMRTSVPGIYAAGDCCEAYEISTGSSVNVALWANAAEQGKIAAENILGMDVSYNGNLICNITHFWDTDFVSIGNNRAEGELTTCTAKKDFSDQEWYFAALSGGGKIQCVNIIDNPELAGVFKDLMQKQFAGQKECKPLVNYSLDRFFLPREIAELVETYLA